MQEFQETHTETETLEKYAQGLIDTGQQCCRNGRFLAFIYLFYTYATTLRYVTDWRLGENATPPRLCCTGAVVNADTKVTERRDAKAVVNFMVTMIN